MEVSYTAHLAISTSLLACAETVICYCSTTLLNLQIFLGRDGWDGVA